MRRHTGLPTQTPHPHPRPGSAQRFDAGRHTQEDGLTPPRSQRHQLHAWDIPHHPPQDVVASLPFCSLLSLPLEVRPPELSEG